MGRFEQRRRTVLYTKRNESIIARDHSEICICNILHLRSEPHQPVHHFSVEFAQCDRVPFALQSTAH